MPYLNELIGLVNDKIKSSSLTDKRFSGAKIAGIAYQVVRQETEDVLEVWPAIVELNKVEQYIGVDDAFPLTIYHRILNNAYADDAKTGQFGDGFTAQVCTTDAVMIVSGKRNPLKLTSEQLEALIVAGFPDQFINGSIDGLQLFSAKVVLRSSDMDSMRVFSNEYKNVQYFLSAEDIFFSMNYSIVSRYKKSCFNICEPCE